MTRWARSGNSQKHTKMPGDATPWEEFARNAKDNPVHKKYNNQGAKKHTFKNKHKFQNKKLNNGVPKVNIAAEDKNNIRSRENKFSWKENKVKEKGNNDLDTPLCKKNNSVTEENWVELNNSTEMNFMETEKDIEYDENLRDLIVNPNSPVSEASTGNQGKKYMPKMFRGMLASESGVDKRQTDENAQSWSESNNQTKSGFIKTEKSIEIKEKVDISMANQSNTAGLSEPQVLSKSKKRRDRKRKLLEFQALQSGVHEMKNDEKHSGNAEDRNAEVERNTKNIGNECNVISPQSSRSNVSETHVLSKNQKRKAGKRKFLEFQASQSGVHEMKNDEKHSGNAEDRNSEVERNTKNIGNECNVIPPQSSRSNVSETQVLSKNQSRKAKWEKKLQELCASQSDANKKSKDGEPNDGTLDASSLSADQESRGKKNFYLDKVQRERKRNGITLLPSKIEGKIYKIKRRLREKGVPTEMIIDIVRKERRTQELQLRRSTGTKPCFNCRKRGHLLAECPLPLGKSNQETGICFKCGSTEHSSYRCRKKIAGYPLAKCFVCKEQGHISKDCPQNDHGVYPKGGNCNLCGNINHLKKDCPSLYKKKEETVTLHTINETGSIDAEIMETSETSKREVFKKSKIVKF